MRLIDEQLKKAQAVARRRAQSLARLRQKVNTAFATLKTRGSK